jgi:hypothetical protein
MEQFFTPTRRLQDLWEQDDDAEDPWEYTEVQLAVPVEEFLICRWVWEDLCSFASGDVADKIIWITNDMFLVVGDVPDDLDFESTLFAHFTITTGQVQALTLFKDRITSTGVCSVFWRAIETSNSVTLRIERNMMRHESFPSGPILS